MSEFKVGDWCYCEFELHQITDIPDGRITGVSDGLFSIGSYSLNDRCFPIEMQIKIISEYFAENYKRINDLNLNFLNYPDIHNKFIELWVSACSNKDNGKFHKEYFEMVAKFTDEAIEKLSELTNTKLRGIPLFRHQLPYTGLETSAHQPEEFETDTFDKAVSMLREALKNDEGYRLGWQANIAMAFQDAVADYQNIARKYLRKDDIHIISNTAANNFLESLCSQPEEVEINGNIATEKI